ncbi:hypothetical protein B2J93_7418 [Marssonina coronariae]|uniref:AMP-dependent synthetase/ligase domain-containing protein n=1 Tax=Diplocarpon coronariae TaxID=2795749 RepID=A0A218Z713_9HELO|nr:hypothetical protein B2J93_7418 [Marssonina coronariae]
MSEKQQPPLGTPFVPGGIGKKGHVVGFFSPNCVDTPASTFGALWAGGVVSPANPAYSVKEVAFQRKDSGSKALITQASCLQTAVEAAKGAGLPRDRILLMGDVKYGGVVYLQHSIASAKPAHRSPRYVSQVNDLSFLFYVCRALLVIHSRHRGAKVTVLPAFKPETFLNATQAHKITFAYLVPPIILSLGKSPLVASYDLSSPKIIASAAAPLTLALIQSVSQGIKIPIKQAWGVSEASPVVTTMLAGDWQKAIGSVGRALPNQSIKIDCEAGDVLPPGKDGEIWVRGPNIFPGYTNDPTATADCMTDGGFMKMGDIGHISQQKDTSTSPTEGAHQVQRLPGPPSKRPKLRGPTWSRGPLAAEKGVEDEVLKRQIREWIHAKGAHQKKSRGGLVRAEKTPKSAAGKILRRVSRDRVEAEGEGKTVRAKL